MTDANFYAVGLGQDFIVFNDGPLSLEPVVIDDLQPISIHPGMIAVKRKYDSCAWSSDVPRYFIILGDGILLLNTKNDEGYFCEKKSAMFIEMVLSHAPAGRTARTPAGRTMRAKPKRGAMTWSA